MPRFVAPLSLLLVFALVGCPDNKREEPKPGDDPAATAPIETPKPAVDVPAPGDLPKDPVAEPGGRCEKDLKKAMADRYAVEDESQFLRASVAASQRGALPSAPTLPAEPFATAPCEDKLEHAEKVADVFRTYRDELKRTLNPGSDDGKKDDGQKSDKKDDGKKSDDKKAGDESKGD